MSLPDTDRDAEFMRIALAEAERAKEIGEVPVGAAVVYDGKVISVGHNQREKNGMATAHAELLAIEEACRSLGGWRLSGCTLYVTLEPCPMCAGSIVNSRIDRVVFGARDSAAGCLGSVINFNSYPFNHAFSVSNGVCEPECKRLLRDFFEEQRQKKKRDNIQNEK
ncbi:MAG: tRNA adenosine(34) deaminase TadA [Clostridia bacterium]|nr:tRNA adenosine(34) deaminase TadA [Clostridia bacterium]